MRNEPSVVSDLSVLGTAVLIVVGLLVLAVRLGEVQVTGAADYQYEGARQAVRRVQVGGERGRILDRRGRPLAENRRTLSITVNPENFQKRTWDGTALEISNAIDRVAKVIGRQPKLGMKAISRHVNQSLALPLCVWRGIDDAELARFSEHQREFEGFECEDEIERVYPFGSLAAHVIGYVGSDYFKGEEGDEKFNFRLKEMKGRSGIEDYYDDFLRGVPGERKLVVDARGFAVSERTVIEPRRGPDLTLSIDADIQRLAESQLKGERGACVVIDPRNGDVLALASAPGFDLNDFVPILRQDMYDRYAGDPNKPLLNRASGGAYAPGSTFKTVTALAGMAAGHPADGEYECCGVFELGSMHLHCARRWGHGPLDMRNALKESCNTFFCNLGVTIGTNALISAARQMGLGSKTGLDLGVDMAGVVPDDQWKRSTYGERWYPGDLAQMSIGQGMLLVSPLQMALVAGAIGTGYLVTPHLKLGVPVTRRRVGFSDAALGVVRDGMRMVVDGGTGQKGGEGVAVAVAGKTGTAEVGRGESRRKNTWFMAYAPLDAPTVAIAMVIENGASGGGTTAPKVCEVLKGIFND